MDGTPYPTESGAARRRGACDGYDNSTRNKARLGTSCATHEVESRHRQSGLPPTLPNQVQRVRASAVDALGDVVAKGHAVAPRSMGCRDESQVAILTTWQIDQSPITPSSMGCRDDDRVLILSTRWIGSHQIENGFRFEKCNNITKHHAPVEDE
jgi:hypothetical protein